MERQDSGTLQEMLIGGIVTFVFVGAKNGEPPDFGGQLISHSSEGRTAIFARPADGIVAAVAAVAMSADNYFAGVSTGEYQPGQVSESVRRVGEIAAVGQAGQVVVSMVTRELARLALPVEYEFHSMGAMPSLSSVSEILLLVEHPLLPLNKLADSVHEPARRRNRFIGRRRELDEIRKLLDAYRIVSILGHSGLGKSALLSRLISEIDGEFTDGVAKLDLSPMTQAALVEPALIRLLEAPKLAGEDHLEALKAYLGPRRFLLVLDNGEHLVTEVRRIAAALVEACPDVAILIGSRRALRLSDEHRYHLEGLEVPSIAEDWRVMRDYDAVALFADRAQAVDGRFCLTAENSADVANLCRRLDGNPLAIELAASKTKALSPKQILGRLDEYRFELLKDTDASRPDHQKNLEATIRLGYVSLREESQALLRRLSVFLGAFTVDQAIQVCTDAQLTPQNVLASFEEFVDGSMLNSSPTSGSEKRFQMPETIRAFARDRLREKRESETFLARHRQWGIAFAAQAEAGLAGREQSWWLSQLDACYDDIRSIIEWQLTRRGDATVAIRMLLSIYPFFFARQFLHEGLRLTAKVVKVPSAEESPELARALNLASIFATRVSDEESARAFAILSVMHARKGKNLSLLARSRNSLAFIAQDAGRLNRARRHFLGAAAAFRKLGESVFEVRSLINLSSLETTMGLLEQARAHLEESSEPLKAIEDPTLRASFLQNAAHLSLAERMPVRALGYLKQTIELHAETQDIDGLATCLRNCAYAHEMLGYFDETAMFIGAAKGLGKRVEQHAFDYEAEAFRAVTWRTTQALGQADFAALSLEGSRLRIPELLAKLIDTLNAIFK